ncbi:AzlD domain-containing protein [Sporosarcina sp. ANT_H38]|uniref:AzlD domain-containing protein n=1 Tax=Sporosarcina sp. ANT_H38 TaxID=2597358 RepID=UPI0011F3ACB2|nr:AzlD domain-containing protein [Sporosarcina sp. ANT_H38]KAA0944090.1 AzlD domain-containing protein [Sporosarcina sp. ANT_H38]
MKINNALPYTILASIILMDIFIVAGLINIFFGWDPTIIAGVIAFVGAIIGGSLTLIGVKWTLTSQFEKEDRGKYEENRTFLSVSRTKFNYEKQDKVGRIDNHRILITESFTYLDGFNQDVVYYSVIRYGGSEIVTNCLFSITVGNDGNFEDNDTIEAWVDYFEKNEEILIPICSKKLRNLNPWIKEIKITLYTQNNDKIEFTQSEVDRKRVHIFFEGDKKHTLGFETKHTAWTQK